MALNAYLTLRGQKSGEIHGSVTQKGRENKIMVIAVSHEILSPRDASTGLPTGKRQHKPFVFTKELDKSSPLLYNVLTTNENIIEATFEFMGTSIRSTTVAGVETVRYTVRLTNANIASINFHMPNTRDPNTARFAEYEEIALTYEQITWTWSDGGIMADDSWISPRI